MATENSYGTLVPTYQIKRCHIPDSRDLNTMSSLNSA